VVALPSAGVYSVELRVGDLGSTAHDRMGIFLEGSLVDTVSTPAKTMAVKSYAVTVSDGQLTLRSKTWAGRTRTWRLRA